MKKGNNQSLLWELNSSTTAKSYLLGTMHVRDYRAFIYQDVITDYIDQCKIFATEFDLRERHQLRGNDFANLPDGQSLEILLGKHKYNRLRKILLKSFSVNLDLLNKTLPLFIINMLTEQILTKSKSVPLDTFLWQYAENTHRDLRGVETFAEQLTTLSNIPIKYQVKSLLAIGKNPKKFRKQISNLIELYVKGDIKDLYKRSKKSLGKQRKLLLYDRNKIMEERIRSLMLEKTSFIAIGAGHLGGKQGVLRLIKKNGISVKPVPLDLI